MFEGQLYKIGEVAEHFGVQERTVRRWVVEGKISHVRTPGGGLRFPAAVFVRTTPTTAEGHQDATAQ